jgi:hypothetical protein
VVSTVAVALDAAALQRPVHPLVRGRAEHAGADQASDQRIVPLGAELAAPAGETEIGELEALRRDQRDRAGVAQPGVVIRQRHEADAFHIHVCGAQRALGVTAHAFIGDDHDQRLETGHSGSQRGVGGFHLGQALGPVGALVRPGYQHRVLRFPFGRQAQVGGGGHRALASGSEAAQCR